MNTLIHADIFFFITAIAVVLVTIIICVIGVYIVGIMRDAKYIARKLRHAADELEEDFEVARREIREEGNKAKYILDFFLGRFLGKRKGKPRTSSHKKQDSEGTV